jgi:hypothetical protein
MVSIVKWAAVAWLSVMAVSSEGNLDKLKKDQAWVCVRWQWTNSPVDGRVTCVEWAVKDCANRLYPDICKRGG